MGHVCAVSVGGSSGGAESRSSSACSSFTGLSADDIANVQSGYASGLGIVITLNDAGVWVDGGYFGTERGTQAQPFNTLGEGAAGVPPASSGVVVHLQSDVYPENAVITRNMVLRAEGGPVLVGN